MHVERSTKAMEPGDALGIHVASVHRALVVVVVGFLNAGRVAQLSRLYIAGVTKQQGSMS